MTSIQPKYLLLVVALSQVFACGTTPKSRIYEKQNTPSDIKINHLNLASNTLGLRFEYRSYREKELESMKCDVTLNGDSSFAINKSFNRKIDTFSTEIINIDELRINNKASLIELNSIDYTLECTVDYDKGNEFLSHESVLHLVPGEKSKYR